RAGHGRAARGPQAAATLRREHLGAGRGARHRGARPSAGQRRPYRGHQGGDDERLVRRASVRNGRHLQDLRGEQARRGALGPPARGGEGSGGPSVRSGGGGVVRQTVPPPDRVDQTGNRIGGLGPGVFGPLLIGVGVLFLVDRLAVAIGIRGILWVLLFGLAAAAFMWLYASDRRHWWALLPGFGF